MQKDKINTLLVSPHSVVLQHLFCFRTQINKFSHTMRQLPRCYNALDVIVPRWLVIKKIQPIRHPLLLIHNRGGRDPKRIPQHEVGNDTHNSPSVRILIEWPMNAYAIANPAGSSKLILTCSKMLHPYQLHILCSYLLH